MNEEARDSLDTSSTVYLEEMQETLLRIESALAQATDSMASMRGTLHRLITFISAGNDIAPAPAEPRAITPVPSEDVSDTNQPAPEIVAPVTPIEGEAKVDEAIDAPSITPSAYERLVNEQPDDPGEELDPKIDAASVLSRVDERLRGLRFAHEGEEPSDTAKKA